MLSQQPWELLQNWAPIWSLEFSQKHPQQTHPEQRWRAEKTLSLSPLILDASILVPV